MTVIVPAAARTSALLFGAAPVSAVIERRPASVRLGCAKNSFPDRVAVRIAIFAECNSDLRREAP